MDQNRHKCEICKELLLLKGRVIKSYTIIYDKFYCKKCEKKEFVTVTIPIITGDPDE